MCSTPDRSCGHNVVSCLIKLIPRLIRFCRTVNQLTLSIRSAGSCFSKLYLIDFLYKSLTTQSSVIKKGNLMLVLKVSADLCSYIFNSINIHINKHKHFIRTHILLLPDSGRDSNPPPWN